MKISCIQNTLNSLKRIGCCSLARDCLMKVGKKETFVTKKVGK